MTRIPLIAAILLLCAPVSEARLKNELVASGIARPVFVTAPPGDTGRLFIVEQHSGRIRVLDLASGEINTNDFIKITGITTGSEQGLLGLAFHPRFAENGFFYVNFTTAGGGAAGHTEIARYTANGDPATSSTADPASKKLILRYNQPESNHNGGWLGFGLDGFLYISSGDGGGGDDQHGQIGNGQNRQTLLGKIMRIDVDSGDPYTIPDGNPFKEHDTFAKEIWAFGLRNPWRCSIDRLTGDLWIGDVGQGLREEIDRIPNGTGGLNFGWRPREGIVQEPLYPNESPVTTATEPVHDYPHSVGYCVTGGYVYRGSLVPELAGKYLFADYGTGKFWTLDTSSETNEVLDVTTEINSPAAMTGVASFGEDGRGELYVCSLSQGRIYRIVSSNRAPALTGISAAAGQFEFSFTAGAGQSYRVEWTDVLPAASQWETLREVPAAETEGSVTITNELSGTARYFRVVAE